MPSLSEKRQMQEIKQRIQFYKYLHSVLSKSGIDLIAPLHQSSALNGKKSSGYCHGYCVAWEEMVSSDQEISIAFKWTDLYSEEAIQYFIKPDERVEYLQISQNKNYNHSTYCKKALLSQSLKDYFTQEKCEAGTMYTLDFGRMPCMGAFFFKRYPNKIKQWHESRFYIDNDSFFHWFDPNFGWLKSNVPNPPISSFFWKLNQIFLPFDYDKRYQFVSIVKVKLDCLPFMELNSV